MLGASSVASLLLICGQFSIWLGANILLLASVQTVTCYSVLSDSVHIALYSVHLKHGIRGASISGHLNYSKTHAHIVFVRLDARSHRFDWSRGQRAALERELAISTVSEHDV